MFASFLRSSEEELKLRRASLVIGVVAALIFICCAAMVAVTLYLTPEMDRLAAGKDKCDTNNHKGPEHYLATCPCHFMSTPLFYYAVLMSSYIQSMVPVCNL